MSPKEVKKSQKKKEKEEKEEEKKKRRLDAAKSKKGKAKNNDNDPANAELDVELETETVHVNDPHIPPKSVNVRLTKVEVGKLTRINSLALPEVGQATATTPEEKTKSTKGNMRLKSLQPTVEGTLFSCLFSRIVINTFMPPLSSAALRLFQILDSSSNKRKYLQGIQSQREVSCHNPK